MVFGYCPIGKPFTIQLVSARSERTLRRDIGYAVEHTGWTNSIVGNTESVVVGFEYVSTSFLESESTVA